MTNRNLHSTTNNIGVEDSLLHLPDLSTFRDEEKQHILNVLVRDENLRLKHLSRFMQLRKEVSELEQKSKATSSSVCARCQSPFGLIFNTGDSCPKCLAKVCRQCRLMYNVNDNGWLCRLCCKQMQLMSYSGEWIYSIHSSLQKASLASSPSTPITRHISRATDSDLEMDEPSPPPASSSKRCSFVPVTPPPTPNPVKAEAQKKIKNKLLVQTSVDEQRLRQLQDRANGRLSDVVHTQPLPRKTLDVVGLGDLPNGSVAQIGTGSNENPTKSVPISKRTLASRVMKNDFFNKRVNIPDSERFLLDLPPDWLSQKNKLNRKRLKIQRYYHSASRDSDQDSPSNRLDKMARKRLSVSMLNLRETIHPLIQSNPSASRHVSAAERNRKSDVSVMNEPENTSLRIPKLSNGSNHRTPSNSSQLSVDESKSNAAHSSNTLLPINPNDIVSSLQRTRSPSESVATTNSKFSLEESPHSTRSNRLECMRHLRLAIDSDDEMDDRFEKEKTGSQSSIDSSLSDGRARFDLDVSGSIELRLSYESQTSSLDILIRRCTNLTKIKRYRTLNPYVKIYLLPEKSKQNKRKTAIKKGTSNPCFGEIFRYRLNRHNFNAYILWISVWSEASLGRNDFLGELYLPLAHCTWDRIEEHQLLSRLSKENKCSDRNIQLSELEFDLLFLEHSDDNEFGRIEIDSIQGRAIGSSKRHREFVCKGLLLPDKTKQKLVQTCRGSSPYWDGSLTWDDIHRDTLRNLSIEISISIRERFRKSLFGYIQLNIASNESDNNKTVKWFDQTQAEQSIWRSFIQQPTKRHHCQLPLRRTTNGKK